MRILVYSLTILVLLAHIGCQYQVAVDDRKSAKACIENKSNCPDDAEEPIGNESDSDPTPPTASLDEQYYNSAQSLALTTSLTGAKIYYTLDGSTPTESSQLYTGPISINSTMTVRAIVVSAIGVKSPVVEYPFVISSSLPEPTASLSPGLYSTAQSVTLKPLVKGAEIYYTTNGANPTTSDQLYSGPIALSVTTNLKWLSVKNGWDNSPIGSANYRIDTIAPTAGSFNATSAVTTSGFTLNWAAASDNETATNDLEYLVCSGASAAAISTVNQCINAEKVLDFSINELSLTVSNKQYNTTYYYNVVVRDEAGHMSIYNGISVTTLNDTTPPSPGSFSAATQITSSSLRLNWTAATDNLAAANQLSYLICSGAAPEDIDEVSECKSADLIKAYTTNITTYVVTNLNNDTMYHFNIVVKDPAGQEGIYEGISVSTAVDSINPTAGSFSATTAITETSMTLNWTAASDDHTTTANLEYLLCKGNSANAVDTVSECEAAKVFDYTSNKLTQNVTSLTPNTTYYFNVVVQDATGNKSLYAGTSATTTADATSPTAGSFAATSGISTTGFTLNWTAGSDNITDTDDLTYYLCLGANAAAISTVSGCESATKVMDYTANTLTYSITGQSSNKTFYYNVIVRDAAGLKTIYEGKQQSTLSLPPDLEDAVASIDLDQNQAMTAYAFTNNGAAAVSCSASPSLPSGLSVNVDDNDTCEISGTPTQALTSTEFTITATSADGSQSNATVTIKVNPYTLTTCPTNWTLVDAYSDAYITVGAFCVMKYHARNVGGVATSQPNGLPWTYQSRTDAIQHCMDANPNYDLISNQQWMSMARQIETAQSSPGVYLNWSNNSNSGNNFINMGHSDTSPYQILEASTDENPCYGTNNNNCADVTHNDFSQKRTHVFENGQVIWDLAGNIWDIMKDTVTFSYGLNRYWTQVDNTSGEACTAPTCNGPQGRPKVAFGPIGDYTAKYGSTFEGGLGSFSTYYSYGLIYRGGDLGLQSGAGVFTTSLDPQSDSGTLTDPVGFRCVTAPLEITPPVLADIGSTNLIRNSAMTALRFTNTGANVSSCTALTPLPSGLSVEVDMSVAPHSCQIIGTPTALGTGTYTIQATAADSSIDSATVEFNVVD